MVLVDVYHVNVEVVVIQYNSALASRLIEKSSIESSIVLGKKIILSTYFLTYGGPLCQSCSYEQDLSHREVPDVFSCLLHRHMGDN